jgi:hypothetical protein
MSGWAASLARRYEWLGLHYIAGGECASIPRIDRAQVLPTRIQCDSSINYCSFGHPTSCHLSYSLTLSTLPPSQLVTIFSITGDLCTAVQPVAKLEYRRTRHQSCLVSSHTELMLRCTFNVNLQLGHALVFQVVSA